VVNDGDEKDLKADDDVDDDVLSAVDDDDDDDDIGCLALEDRLRLPRLPASAWLVEENGFWNSDVDTQSKGSSLAWSPTGLTASTTSRGSTASPENMTPQVKIYHRDPGEREFSPLVDNVST
jgi:hypothetical protein